MNHTLGNNDRRWNNAWRERAAKYLDLAKRAKRAGHKEFALHAMRGYYRCIANIRKEK